MHWNGIIFHFLLCFSLLFFSQLFVRPPHVGPNYGGGNEDNGTSFKRSHACTPTLSALNPAASPPPTRTSTGDSCTLIGKSGSVSCGVTAPFSWVLVQKAVCALQESISQSCISSAALWWGEWWPPPRGLMPYPSLLHPEPLSLFVFTSVCSLCLIQWNYEPCCVGPPEMGHGGEFWQNVVLWRGQWQITLVFLAWEPHEWYEQTKR